MTEWRIGSQCFVALPTNSCRIAIEIQTDLIYYRVAVQTDVPCTSGYSVYSQTQHTFGWGILSSAQFEKRRSGKQPGMSDPLRLEIHLFRRDPSSYIVEIQLVDPNSQQERAPVRSTVSFDEAALREQNLNPSNYGKQLFQDLFKDPKILAIYDEARNLQGLNQPANPVLRIRLYIDGDSLELHTLRWETLRDHRSDEWLLGQDDLRFSRFLSGNRWEPIEKRAKGDLRALVIIANPQGLGAGDYAKYAPVDVAGEKQRAQDSLGEFYAEDAVLASDPQEPTRVTLETIRQHLRDGYTEQGIPRAFDVIYLAAHGGLISKGPDQGPVLLLDDENGNPIIVRGADLADEIQSMSSDKRPRLFVLASCKSADAGAPGPAAGEVSTADDKGAMSALGPMLSRAGVPAVVAMQGSVTMQTVETFMPAFFSELRAAEPNGGLVDRAMSVARSAVRQRADAYMPVLYLRLKDGKLWYVPGYTAGYEDWQFLVERVNTGKAIPILGHGLFETVCGPFSQAAYDWAEKVNYPLAPHNRQNLYQVAQFLANRFDADYPIERLYGFLDSQLAQTYNLSPVGDNGEALRQRLAEVGALRRAQNPNNSYEILARLPINIYILSTPDNLLVDALTTAGVNKEPVIDYLRWNNQIRDLQTFPSEYKTAKETGYQPTTQRPLVYYLFGCLHIPESLVLTEDNYFDYLMSLEHQAVQIPLEIITAWKTHAILFLGFQADDWIFRLLLRSILNEERRDQNKKYKTVSMQISPDENTPDPASAQRYLEKVFTKANIGVFWGNSDEFLKELWRRMQ